MKTYIISPFLLLITMLSALPVSAQRGYTYRSISAALANPDQVYILKLKEQPLSEFPKEIVALKNLEDLDLEETGLTRIPKEIGELTNLKRLDMDENRIRYIDPAIGKLTKLEHLDIDQNALTKVPEEIGNLVNLKYLDMDHNQIKELPASMANLTKLVKLEIAGNDLKDIPVELGSLKHLTYFTFGANSFTGMPSALMPMLNVAWLQMDDEQIELQMGHTSSLSQLARTLYYLPGLTDEERDLVQSSITEAGFSTGYYNPYQVAEEAAEEEEYFPPLHDGEDATTPLTLEVSTTESTPDEVEYVIPAIERALEERVIPDAEFVEPVYDAETEAVEPD